MCIDPGHPSEINDGYKVVNGTSETRQNWLLALALKERLVRSGYAVTMTKTGEKELVTNRRRAEIANDVKARLMVRIHADSGNGTGFRVFFPDAAGRDGAIVGPSPEVCKASRLAALAMRAGMASVLSGDLRDNGVRSERTGTVIGARHGALIGSIHSQVPTVTIETVFLTNARDAAYIQSPGGRAKLADALAEGVRLFMRPAPPAGGHSVIVR